MIHFELIFKCEILVKVHIFVYGWPIVPKQFVEKIILSPLSCISIFVKNQLAICEWDSFCPIDFCQLIFVNTMLIDLGSFKESL